MHRSLPRFTVLLLMLLAVSCLAPAAFAQPGSDRDASPPGAFDYYLMSFTIAPSFCALSTRNAEKQECRTATDAAYHETPLTVHGLWPNRERVSVNQQPQYCAGPRLGSLPPGLQQPLSRYMPGVEDGLDRYEWTRHGSCSGLAPDQYFAKVVQLAEMANQAIGSALTGPSMLGHEVRIDDLLAAVSAKDPRLASAIVVNCRFSRARDDEPSRAYITEIRIVLSKDFGPIPADTVGFGQNSGCPRRAGFLPDGFSRS